MLWNARDIRRRDLSHVLPNDNTSSISLLERVYETFVWERVTRAGGTGPAAPVLAGLKFEAPTIHF